MTKLRYFAWVRERVGQDEEDVELSTDIVTVSDLLSYLKQKGENYAYALEQADFIRVAIDQEHVSHNAPIKGAKEIALFPPMTGG